MGLIPPELSLDCRPTFIPKTISQLLGDLSANGDVLERLLKLDDFVKRLEDEMRKIDAFKRELPLCMLLLNDAIGILKEEAMQCKKLNAKPVLEEFIPIKKRCDDEEEKDDVVEEDGRDKMNWMSSVQLWNSDHSHNFSVNHSKQSSVEQIEKRNREENLAVIDDAYESCKSRNVGRAFMPLKNYSVPQVAPATARKEAKDEIPAAGLSLVTPGIKNPREELVCSSLSSKTGGSRAGSSSGPCVQSNSRSASQSSQQQTTRKQRRCWSPELHRRFVNALQQLGGSQAATPKQIRELMQVDGLTNDEVKSHLQKYRLHTRRVPPTNSSSTNQPLAVIGNLWGTQEQYGESLKPSPSQSGSPQGPLHLVGTTGGTSTTGGDSTEDEEDKRSDSSYSWKSHVHTSGKDYI